MLRERRGRKVVTWLCPSVLMTVTFLAMETLILVKIKKNPRPELG